MSDQDIGVIEIRTNDIVEDADTDEERRERLQDELQDKLGPLGGDNWREAFTGQSDGSDDENGSG